MQAPLPLCLGPPTCPGRDVTAALPSPGPPPSFPRSGARAAPRALRVSAVLCARPSGARVPSPGVSCSVQGASRMEGFWSQKGIWPRGSGESKGGEPTPALSSRGMITIAATATFIPGFVPMALHCKFHFPNSIVR